MVIIANTMANRANDSGYGYDYGYDYGYTATAIAMDMAMISTLCYGSGRGHS